MSSRSHSSGSSSSSGWTKSSRSGVSTRCRERRLPNTPAVNALLYFTGRDPRKVKGVRVYERSYDDDETRSNNSGSSAWSWSSVGGRNVEIYLLESRHMYWHDDEPVRPTPPARNQARKPPGKRPAGGEPPWKAAGKKPGPPPRGGEQSDSDDSASDDESMDGFANGGPRPGMMPPPMHGHGPPPGTFQPMYGSPPPMPPNPAFTPRPHPHFAPPQPHPMAGGMPPPPPGAPGGAGGGGGKFVPGPGRLQVWTD